MSILHIGSIFCSFPASLISSTYTDKNNPFSVNEWTFTIWNFSHPFSRRTFSNCLSHDSSAKGWPYRFRSRGTNGSSILNHEPCERSVVDQRARLLIRGSAQGFNPEPTHQEDEVEDQEEVENERDWEECKVESRREVRHTSAWNMDEMTRTNTLSQCHVRHC